LGFGVLGYAFVKAGIPTAPFIIGFILGPMAETSFRRGLQLSKGDYSGFLTNPISGAFLALAAVSIALQLWGEYRASRGRAVAGPLKLGGEE
ncbi:MAG: tripartite tricarboxylate transporter permease, partial [Paracoccus sp. (in: a-proteobacteria)]|nr:tripartite tricarboxylate transporter permease [Paracoccus sp. (in: a-proteobacteria)]